MQAHPHRPPGSGRLWLAVIALALPAHLPANGVPDGPFAGELEYFIGSDPGEGMGTPVAVTGGQAGFTVATSDLAPGTHILYLRARLPGGEWGPRFPWPFAVEGSGATESVAALQYAWDGAMGDDDWTTVTVDPATGRALVPLQLDVSGLTIGTHLLHLRGVDSSGTAGIPSSASFSVEGSGANETVAALQYAWDGATGDGDWTTVAVNPATGRAEVPLQLAVGSLTTGTHVLHLRGVDSSGTAGPAQPWTLAVVPGALTGHPPPAGSIVAYIEQSGTIVESTYSEWSLRAAAAAQQRSLLMRLDGLADGAANLGTYVLAQTGQPGPQLDTPFTVVAPGSNGYAAWRDASGYFSPEEQADPAVSGPAADPDLDGLANLLEFAAGLHPREPLAQRLPEIALQPGGLQLAFRHKSGGTGHRVFGYTVDGVSFRLEWCHDPAGSDWIAGGGEYFTVTGIEDNGDGTETVHVKVLPEVTAAAATTFLRLHLVPL